MRILLTGATGFVGSHLLKGLLADGHEVCVVKRSYSDIWRVCGLLEQCKVYNLDETAVGQSYREWPVDCVVHCATHYTRDRRDGKNNENIREYRKSVDSNLLFPLELLGEGKEYGVKYFVNTASFFENQFRTENDLGRRMYSYSYVLSKAQFRQWGHMFASEYGMAFVNMKLEHVYGEMDNEGKFIPYVVRQCKENTPFLELTEGTQQRDFIHVSDVVNAYRTVISHLERQGGGGYMSYNVGTGRMRSLREFVELIHRALHSTTRLEWGTLPMGKGELMQSMADNRELRELGWNPMVVTESEIEQKFGGGGINFTILVLVDAARKGGAHKCVS